MEFRNLAKINELVVLNTSRKQEIVLNPKGEYKFEYRNTGAEDQISTEILFDTVEWKIPKEKEEFVKKLEMNEELSNEDKIITLFDELAKSYTYDDNILSYIKKIEDDKFYLPDEYGRTVGEEWEKNRSTHNKKVCYEVSRILAKSLTEIFKEDENYDICVLWDEPLTHYQCALTCPEYTLTLDLDDFNNIKDLTRVKTGLTIEGIKVLEDPNYKFTQALQTYNKDRDKHAIKSISNKIDKRDMDKNAENNFVFLRNALEILKEDHELDSQGMFEYMKEIVDIKIGPKEREKVWKKQNNGNNGNTYIRCLTVKGKKDKKYIIDVDLAEIREFNDNEFEVDDPVFIKFEKLERDWEKENYDGR